MIRLRNHLLRWLLIPLSVVWIVGFRINYVRTLEQANQAYDRTLLGSALAMAERVSVQSGELTVDVPYAALEMLETRSQDRIFYKVSCLDPPSLVTGQEDLPAPPTVPAGDQPLFHNAMYNGEPVRLVALRRPVYEAVPCGPLLVQVGETTGAREALSRRMLFDTSAMQLTLIAVAALLIALGVRRGLLPLRRIRDEIKGRDQTDLTPIATQTVPREVIPLIEAINLHTGRQRQLNEAHRQFIADASHQLKTPLTVLKAQAALALAQHDARRVREIVKEIHDSTDATSRMIQQLLALARSESGHVVDDVGLDLTELVRQTSFDLLPQALEKRIDLGFDGSGPVWMTGQPLLLRELAANLVDNAIRYTPEGGQIDVSVACDATGNAVLNVNDSGPGIPPDERAKVFGRFYRLRGSRADGCGLGLSIVRQIADRHGARVELGQAPGSGGLRVSVVFPPRRLPPA
ncbi:sensor histidine kinase N-terminal domain-containing protein [Cupriavidus sp. 2MCAB6]|uniref:sensor histidine kinase n=1 Tax=Cupriavidus sp. 2MCAB6 TaxID=3232981 RepID=UPI003F93C146